MQINPWSSAQYADYARLRDEFGIEEFDPFGLPEQDKLMRRGVIFGSRGYEYIRTAILENKPFIILTGLMPSGKMHLGHKLVIDQILYYQKRGAHIYIAVADIESYGARNVSFEDAKRMAIDEYILNYIALGIESKDTQIYFQSQRRAVKDIAFTLGKKIPYSQYSAIYGFEDTVNMCHMLAPMIQVGDILHPMLEEYSGPLPLLVPVGVDQDPHMRLTRDLAAAFRLLNVTLTKDGQIGIFVKGDENVQSLLDKAKSEMEILGFADFKMMPKYKALYIPGATENDIAKINTALILMESKMNHLTFFPPAATFHRFMTGLTGGKMSSSDPATAIFLSDTPEDGMKKVRSSITGGGITIEEHKKHGGKPEQCSVYELFVYHLLEDDSELRTIYEDCKGGRLLCGDCKNRAAEGMGEFLKVLATKREEAKGRIDDYLRND